MTRQLLALQGQPDLGEDSLPLVLLLARRNEGSWDDEEAEALGDAEVTGGGGGDDEEESLCVHVWEWGEAAWRSAQLPPPRYAVRSRDGAHAVLVDGIDPSTASNAAYIGDGEKPPVIHAAADAWFSASCCQPVSPSSLKVARVQDG
eukprot:COSAG01_NODE_5378_length_4297_cov_3.601953_2_plen_147_part_00